MSSLDSESSTEIGYPMVCIMVRGTIGASEILCQKVQGDIPAIIFKNTGSAADIITFASDDIGAR